MEVFRGIRADRPYPATGLTSRRWMDEVAITRVDVSWLWLTQRHLSVEALFSPWALSYSGDDFPHVVHHLVPDLGIDDLYLEDGHHRVIRAVLRGDKEILARLFTVSH